MKKNIRTYGIIAIIIILSFAHVPAYGKGQRQTKREQSPSQVATSSPVTTASPIYWTGDGGKGIRLAVLEPTGKGLSTSEQWILSMIQSSITGDFQKFSAMTIIDRQNLEKILSEQKQSMSGNYSDDDYIRIGKLTNTRYILAGSITKTSSTFVLEFAITDAESGERKASYPPKATSPFALENLSIIKEATAELLRQLGVQLTDVGLKELNSTANIAQVKAETALAKGIEAQKQGTIVEALSYYIQANNYNTGLAEATSRMNILTANITSGNIGQDTRNDIAWRKDWVARLQETETFFSNSIKASQPFYIVYKTDIKQGKIDYQKETTDLSIWMGFYPDYMWAEQINEVVNAVKKGLQATGRAEVWGIDWPTKSISTPSPFINQTKNLTSTVVVEIINSEGKSIGRQTIKSPYGFEIKDTVITPIWQYVGDVSFIGVNANLITDKLEIRITTIDGIVAETAVRQKNISIMPFTEWESMLKKQPIIKQKIDIAVAQREREAEAQRQRELEVAAKPYYEKGVRNYNAKNYNQAILDFTEAIRINPNYAEAYNNRGIAYFYLDDKYNEKNYNLATLDFTEAIRINPNYAEAYNNRGKASDYIWNPSYNAVADFTQAIRINPKYAEAYFNRGREYSNFMKGTIYDKNKAIIDFTEAIRINPNYAEAYYWRGNMYKDLEFDYKDINYIYKAIADYTQAIRIDPNYWQAYYSRGIAYSGLGDYNKALTDYTQAIQSNSNNAGVDLQELYRGRAYIYEKLQDFDKAIADYTQAIRFSPNDAMLYNSRGKAYNIKRDKTRAIADFEAALRIDPNYTEAKNNLKSLRGY